MKCYLAGPIFATRSGAETHGAAVLRYAKPVCTNSSVRKSQDRGDLTSIFAI